MRAFPSGVSNAKYLTWVNSTISKMEAYGQNGKSFIIFLFFFLSPLSSLYSFFLSSLILPHTFLSTSHLFSFHSFYFSLSLLFSLPLSLTTPPPQPDADLYCRGLFFFFLKWFDGCVRQWVGSDGDGQISGGGLQWVNSVMGRSLLCFLFFYGGGFGVLLWWFWCDSGGVLMGGWFFYFVFLYIVGFFNVILTFVYIILVYRIE